MFCNVPTSTSYIDSYREHPKNNSSKEFTAIRPAVGKESLKYVRAQHNALVLAELPVVKQGDKYYAEFWNPNCMSHIIQNELFSNHKQNEIGILLIRKSYINTNESLSQSSIETIHERRNGIKSLLVCLSEYLHSCSPTMPASCVLIGITNKYKILPLNI